MAGGDDEAGTDGGKIDGGGASVLGRRARELPRDEMTADNLLEKARRCSLLPATTDYSCHRNHSTLRSNKL